MGWEGTSLVDGQGIRRTVCYVLVYSGKGKKNLESENMAWEGYHKKESDSRRSSSI